MAKKFKMKGSAVLTQEEIHKIQDEAAATLEKARFETTQFMLLLIVRHALVYELRSCRVPSTPLRCLAEVLCILVGVEPVSTLDIQRKRVKDYWMAARPLFLFPSKFAQILRGFDMDHIAPGSMEIIREKLDQIPALSYGWIHGAGAGALCERLWEWIISVEKYDRTAREIDQKMKSLGIPWPKTPTVPALPPDNRHKIRNIQEDTSQQPCKCWDARRK